jgi:hypothetical protein
MPSTSITLATALSEKNLTLASRMHKPDPLDNNFKVDSSGLRPYFQSSPFGRG